METCFNYCSREAGFFSSDERAWINKIHKLKEKYPDLVTILAEPENNDGCIYVKMPVKFLRIQGPANRAELTDEEKAEIRERLTSAKNHCHE